MRLTLTIYSLNDILTDIALRFARCAGEVRLSPNWDGRWPGYCFKYGFMWTVQMHYTGIGYYERHQNLRVPAWLERRKALKQRTYMPVRRHQK